MHTSNPLAQWSKSKNYRQRNLILLLYKNLQGTSQHCASQEEELGPYCIDFHGLSKTCLKDEFPLPNINMP